MKESSIYHGNNYTYLLYLKESLSVYIDLHKHINSKEDLNWIDVYIQVKNIILRINWIFRNSADPNLIVCMRTLNCDLHYFFDGLSRLDNSTVFCFNPPAVQQIRLFMRMNCLICYR